MCIKKIDTKEYQFSFKQNLELPNKCKITEFTRCSKTPTFTSITL